MTTTRLPGTDLDLFPLVLGGNVFGWSADEATSFDVLDDCVRHGASWSVLVRTTLGQRLRGK